MVFSRGTGGYSIQSLYSMSIQYSIGACKRREDYRAESEVKPSVGARKKKNHKESWYSTS